MVLAFQHIRKREHLRRPDVPAAQIEFDYGDKSFNGIVNLGDREEHFGVAHEAVRGLLASMG